MLDKYDGLRGKQDNAILFAWKFSYFPTMRRTDGRPTPAKRITSEPTFRLLFVFSFVLHIQASRISHLNAFACVSLNAACVLDIPCCIFIYIIDTYIQLCAAT